MAIRGTSKYLSVQHEDYIAQIYGGIRSRSSGASDHDAGDVRSPLYLIECKMTGKPGKEPKTPTFIKQLGKIAEEAWEEGKTPILALRYFDPESVLANRDGWIDVVIKLATDDAN